MSDSEPEEPQLKDTDDPFVGSDENQTTDNIPHTSSLFRNLIPLYTKVVDASDALEIDANSNFTFPEIVVIGGQVSIYLKYFYKRSKLLAYKLWQYLWVESKLELEDLHMLH